jgi:hypothetical protein
LDFSPAILAAKELAVSVGVFGAALLIVALGVAWHLPKILSVLREILRDWQELSLKRQELRHRISRDSESFALEIAKKKLKLVKDQKLEIG